MPIMFTPRSCMALPALFTSLLPCTRMLSAVPPLDELELLDELAELEELEELDELEELLEELEELEPDLPFTVILNAAVEAVAVPSVTLTFTFENTPATVGLPLISPVTVLNVAHEGLLAIENERVVPVPPV